MKYELEYFESILPSLHVGETSPNHQITPETIQAETDRIKAVWRNEVFSSDSERKVELYIQRHQAAIIHLQDQLHTVTGQHKTEEFLNNSLNGLLSYLEKHFSKYFDLSANVPLSYIGLQAMDFSERLPIIIGSFRRKQVPEKLTVALTSSFQEFIVNKMSTVSYRKIIYLKGFLSELERLSIEMLEGVKLLDSIYNSAIYFNFNSLKLFRFLAREIRESCQSKKTLNELLETLVLSLKLINQVQEKPGFSYKPSHKSLKYQLSNWIKEEILFYEKKHQIHFSYVNENIGSIPSYKNFKIHTDLSVAQIAYFARLLVDTNLIRNTNMTELIRFLSNHISSKKMETIALESFRRKFYETEEVAKEVVKQRVKIILEHINKT